jgi:hypothetical protein
MDLEITFMGEMGLDPKELEGKSPVLSGCIFIRIRLTEITSIVNEEQKASFYQIRLPTSSLGR